MYDVFGRAILEKSLVCTARNEIEKEISKLIDTKSVEEHTEIKASIGDCSVDGGLFVIE